MSKKEIIAHYTGWFVFCPVFIEDIDSEDLAPVPKWNAWWLLDAALGVQQAINWLISIANPEACGFMCWGVRKLRHPQRITFETEDE